MSEPCIWQRWPRWKLTENYPAKNCYITCQSWNMHRIWWKKNRRKKWTWPTWVTSQESFAPGENLLSPLPLPQHYGHTSSILRDSYWSAEEDHARPVMDDGLKWRLVFLFSSQSIDELLHLRQHLMWVDGNMDHLCVFVWWRSCRTAAIIQCWTA